MSRPPSIAYVLPWSIHGHGGVNEVVRNLIDQTLRDGRFRPILVDTSWTSGPPDSGDGQAHLTLRRHIRRLHVPGKVLRSSIAYLVHLLPDLWFWTAWCRRHSVAALNIHYVTASMLTLAVVRKLFLRSIRLIVSVHGADVTRYSRSTGLERRMLAFIFRSSDRIVACSNSLAADTRAALPPNQHSKVVTIYNGIDADRTDASLAGNASTVAGVTKPYVINVATYEHKKGQDVLIDAFKILSDEGLPHDLVLIGRRTGYADRLKKQVERLGIRDRVHLLEDTPHPAVLRLIRDSALFVLSSRLEPFGIVLLEAAYLEVPIVATRTGGVPEVLGEDYDHLVRAGDPAALAERMRLVLSGRDGVDPRRLKRRVLRCFGWKAAFRRYCALFDRTASACRK